MFDKSSDELAGSKMFCKSQIYPSLLILRRMGERTKYKENQGFSPLSESLLNSEQRGDNGFMRIYNIFYKFIIIFKKIYLDFLVYWCSFLPIVFWDETPLFECYIYLQCDLCVLITFYLFYLKNFFPSKPSYLVMINLLLSTLSWAPNPLIPELPSRLSVLSLLQSFRLETSLSLTPFQAYAPVRFPSGHPPILSCSPARYDNSCGLLLVTLTFSCLALASARLTVCDAC